MSAALVARVEETLASEKRRVLRVLVAAHEVLQLGSEHLSAAVVHRLGAEGIERLSDAKATERRMPLIH